MFFTGTAGPSPSHFGPSLRQLLVVSRPSLRQVLVSRPSPRQLLVVSRPSLRQLLVVSRPSLRQLLVAPSQEPLQSNEGQYNLYFPYLGRRSIHSDFIVLAVYRYLVDK